MKRKITTLIASLLMITMVGMTQEVKPSFAFMLGDYMNHIEKNEPLKAEHAWTDLVNVQMDGVYDAKMFDELRALPTPPPPPGGGQCIIACEGAFQYCLAHQPPMFPSTYVWCNNQKTRCIGQCGH